MEDKKIELNEANKGYIDRVRKALVDYKIEFTEESIDFVLNKLNKSFEDTAQYSDENLKTILICGLPSHDRAEALKLLGELRKDGINYKITHQILVDILRRDHFFTDMEAWTNLWNLVGYQMMK